MASMLHPIPTLGESMSVGPSDAGVMLGKLESRALVWATVNVID